MFSFPFSVLLDFLLLLFVFVVVVVLSVFFVFPFVDRGASHPLSRQAGSVASQRGTSRGFGPRSLDSEPIMPTVTPRGRLVNTAESR